MAKMTRKIPTHIIVASTSWISRIIISIIQIFVLKMLIEILGTEKYSVFAILTGLMGWFALFDFGIGISLQNYISEYRANNKDFKEILTITFAIVLAVSLICIFILYLLSPYLSSKILKLFNFLSYDEKTILFFITGFCFLLTNIGSVVYKTLYAQDKGYIANIVPVLGYILSASLLFFLKKNNISNNLTYSILFFLLPNALLPLFLFISYIKPEYLLKLDIKKVYPVLKRAGKFWFFALMAAAVLQIDYLILSQYSVPDDIVIYNLLNKIFFFGFFVYNALLTAIWPTFSYNISRGNIELIYKYTKRYLFIGLLYIILFTIIALFFIDYIKAFFLPNSDIKIPSLLVTVMGFYYLLRVWSDTFSMILQSANILKPFIIYVPIQAVISFISQVFLVKRYGLYGIVLGLIVSFIFTAVWILPYCSKKLIFKRLNAS